MISAVLHASLMWQLRHWLQFWQLRNLNSWQSLLPDNKEWQWTAFAILAMFVTYETFQVYTVRLFSIIRKHNYFNLIFHYTCTAYHSILSKKLRDIKVPLKIANKICQSERWMIVASIFFGKLGHWIWFTLHPKNWILRQLFGIFSLANWVVVYDLLCI